MKIAFKILRGSEDLSWKYDHSSQYMQTSSRHGGIEDESSVWRHIPMPANDRNPIIYVGSVSYLGPNFVYCASCFWFI